MGTISEDYPILLEQWDFEKNLESSPFEILSKSNKKVWWKCKECGYGWQSQPNNRTRSQKCPSCIGRAITENNCLAKKCPELAEEWDYQKNGDITPYNIALRSGKKVWWKCNICGYGWECSPLGRTGRGIITKCFNCNCLYIKNPELSKEWLMERNNGISPKDVSYRSIRKVWWKCLKCGCEWLASIGEREIGERKCPDCNCLWSQNTKLALEWHPTKNGNLTPKRVTHGSKKVVWWKCLKCDGEWKAQVQKRDRGRLSCPRCYSLGMKNPELSKEWDVIKNKNLTPFDVTWGSNINTWWKCSKCGFSWKARIMSRVDGNGCPSCSGILLNDGTVCSSMVDAYFYLKFKNENLKFLYNKKYGDLGKKGNCRYDFYFPDNNKYIEVTGFDSGVKFWIQYLRRIVLKKRYVERLGAKFEFIEKKLSKLETQEIMKYIDRNKK